jgi:hypothetical protein
MSESEKRTPISIYLTPRAAMILRDYNEGSGYGSLSRTVEEMILAFDTTYKNVKDTLRAINSQFSGRSDLGNSERLAFFTVLLTNLYNLNSTVSRLNSANTYLQERNP